MRYPLSLKHTLLFIVLAALLAGLFVFVTHRASHTEQFEAPVSVDTLEEPIFISEYDSKYPLYGRVLAEWIRQGAKDYSGAPIVVSPLLTSNESGAVEKGAAGGREALLTDGDEQTWAEWTVNVPEAAFYQIDLDYLPLPGRMSSIQRSLLIDGELPFDEASRLYFPRFYEDKSELMLDEQGDQYRGPMTEITDDWRTTSFIHPERFYKRPYKFFLESGEHTIRLSGIREPMAISTIVLRAPMTLPTYEEVLAEYASQGYSQSETNWIKQQTEVPLEVSEISLRADWMGDPKAEPRAITNVRYNALSGDKWKTGGQTATWEFEVPEDGLYQIAFRYATPTSSQATYRTIYIDGQIPFQELEEYAFPYVKGWHAQPLRQANNEPFQFYLTKGKHTISSVVSLNATRQTIIKLQEFINEMGQLSTDIVKITASARDAAGKITTDRNQDWHLERYMPDLVERLQAGVELIEESIQAIRDVNGGFSPPYISSLQSASKLISGMAADTETIPYKLNELSSAMSGIGNGVQTMKEQRLYVDYMLIGNPNDPVPEATGNYLEDFGAQFQRFLYSFGKSNRERLHNNEDDVTIKVWAARGREWVDIMNAMIREEFTPQTGIRVEMTTLPLQSEHLLLLAYTGGNAPDLALGVAPGIPVEYSMRGALIDLNQFASAKEVVSRFVPGALIPLSFEGGLYALPETTDFNMLFYRTDIMNQLGVEPPQTWKEVYALLPKLQEEGMQFYYPEAVSGFAPFLFQNGGDYYTEDGYSSNLNDPAALNAFKEWTALFKYYKLPLKADFYQRFRNGDMPIGIGNYDVYSKLVTGAPELSGRWSMIPMPGTMREDGVIDRTATGSDAATSAIMMNSTEHPEESWKFLEWWTSEDTQVRFGLEVEGLIGVGSRWNSANVEAMQGMAWSNAEIRAITEQWSWLKEQPIVIGGYFTPRHVTNAWNKVVLLGENERIALEDAVKDINKELLRKQDEFSAGGRKGFSIDNMEGLEASIDGR